MRQRGRYGPSVGALLAMAFATAHPAASVERRPSLCSAAETAIFSCAVGGKVVSLCASPDLDDTKGIMTYRFGRRGAVELAHPETPGHPRTAFVAGIDSTERGDYVRFSRGGFTYTIYALVGTQGRSETDGLLITRGKTVLRDLRCKDFGMGDGAWRLMYRARLPADEPQSIKPR